MGLRIAQILIPPNSGQRILSQKACFRDINWNDGKGVAIEKQKNVVRVSVGPRYVS
jgi:hypothetical protein